VEGAAGAVGDVAADELTRTILLGGVESRHGGGLLPEPRAAALARGRAEAALVALVVRLGPVMLTPWR
jgi:hypothetical protein